LSPQRRDEPKESIENDNQAALPLRRGGLSLHGLNNGRLPADQNIRGSRNRKEKKVERRIYFIAGDVLSNVVMGVAAAWTAAAVVAPSWPMPAGMLAGMLAGMGPGLVLTPLCVALFGAMEVMLPVMLTAMLSGMVFGMAGAMGTPGLAALLLGGGSTGLLVLLLTYAVDARLRGRAR
jgi:hypothetical protein